MNTFIDLIMGLCIGMGLVALLILLALVSLLLVEACVASCRRIFVTKQPHPFITKNIT